MLPVSAEMEECEFGVSSTLPGVGDVPDPGDCCWVDEEEYQPGYFDCDLRCIDQNDVYSYAGNNECNSYQDYYNFDCAEYNYDEGDCR